MVVRIIHLQPSIQKVGPLISKGSSAFKVPARTFKASLPTGPGFRERQGWEYAQASIALNDLWHRDIPCDYERYTSRVEGTLFRGLELCKDGVILGTDRPGRTLMHNLHNQGNRMFGLVPVPLRRCYAQRKFARR